MCEKVVVVWVEQYGWEQEVWPPVQVVQAERAVPIQAAVESLPIVDWDLGIVVLADTEGIVVDIGQVVVVVREIGGIRTQAAEDIQQVFEVVARLADIEDIEDIVVDIAELVPMVVEDWGDFAAVDEAQAFEVVGGLFVAVHLLVPLFLRDALHPKKGPL